MATSSTKLSLPSLKYSGLGNTFTCLDNRDGQVRDLPPFETDGLLLLENSDVADFRMRIFNPDGSEAEMCGNGLRCFKLYLFDLGYTEPTYTIQSKLRIHTVTSEGNRVRATMGPARVISEDPLIIDTGVPHAITFVEDIGLDISELGPKIRKATNANATFVQKGDPVRVRTWERGVEGETAACGTGACAAAVAAGASGEVLFRSGEKLQIEIGEEVSMTGLARKL